MHSMRYLQVRMCGGSTQDAFEAEADLNSCEYRLQLRTKCRMKLPQEV